MARADLVRDEIQRCGIEYIVWLPDSEARYFYDTIASSPAIRLVQVCHEEETIGVYAGLHMGGKKAAVLIQNTGLLHSIDALRGMILDLELPLLLMVGYKGYRQMVQGKQPRNSTATYTEPVLDMLGIKHYLLDNDHEVENISAAYRETLASNRPVAVLIGREYS